MLHLLGSRDCIEAGSQSLPTSSRPKRSRSTLQHAGLFPGIKAEQWTGYSLPQLRSCVDDPTPNDRFGCLHILNMIGRNRKYVSREHCHVRKLADFDRSAMR